MAQIIMAQKMPEKKVSNDIITLISKKILFFEDVIQRTILHVQKNKMFDILGVSEVNNCIHLLFELTKSIKEINIASLEKENTDNAINILQNINNELSSLFKIYGTELFEDLLWICFGNNSINVYATSDLEKHKFELLKKYFHPTSYKILNSNLNKSSDKSLSDESSTTTFLSEKSKNLDATDVSIKVKPFHLKVYGIQVIVHNKKSLIIYGIVDDIIIELLDNLYINSKIKMIKDSAPKSPEFQDETFAKYIKSICFLMTQIIQIISVILI